LAASNEAILKLSKVRDGRDNIIASCRTNFEYSTFNSIENVCNPEDQNIEF
jgi:hypothetical protein